MTAPTAHHANINTPSASHIDISSQDVLATWARKLDATPLQIIEAVEAVGDDPQDVELHLKGTRSTTATESVSAQQTRR